MRTWTGLASMTLSLLVVVAISGCSTTPVVYESGPPSSRIVVKAKGYNRCGFASDEQRTLTTQYTRTSEASWSFGGKVGVGGRIPLGFLLPSLDIEAALSSHYGQKETRTWDEVSSEKYLIPAGSNLLYVVYYQEITRRGTIESYDKRIEYEFPAELSILGSSKRNMPCTPKPQLYMVCMSTEPGPMPSLPPAYQGIDRTWERTDPKDGEILQIDVEIEEPYLVFRVQTDCSSGPCDWGKQWACIGEGPFEVTYDLVFKETTLTFHPPQGGQLPVTAWDHFQDPPPQVQGLQYLRTEYTFH